MLCRLRYVDPRRSDALGSSESRTRCPLQTARCVASSINGCRWLRSGGVPFPAGWHWWPIAQMLRQQLRFATLNEHSFEEAVG